MLEEVADDPTLHDKMTILTRSFQNEHVRSHNDELVFHESVLEISPPQGEIYPGRSVEISAIFKPDKIGEFEKVIYCDVQGREQRLPMAIKGPARQISILVIPDLQVLSFSVHCNKICRPGLN